TGGCTVYFATSGFFVAATGELADVVFFPPQPAEIKEKARETTRQTLQRANSIRLFQERSISPESNWTFPVVTKMSSSYVLTNRIPGYAGPTELIDTATNRMLAISLLSSGFQE